MTEGDPFGSALPPDDVLQELGRLIWAAINLEDTAYFICRCVKPQFGPFDDIFIGRRIDQAGRDLKLRPEGDLRTRAGEWLTEAKAALDERNVVVHSTPGAYILSDEPFTVGDPVLMYANSKRPPVHTPLTVDGLRKIRDRLEAARSGWRELGRDLFTSKEGVY